VKKSLGNEKARTKIVHSISLIIGQSRRAFLWIESNQSMAVFCEPTFASLYLQRYNATRAELTAQSRWRDGFQLFFFRKIELRGHVNHANPSSIFTE